MVVHDPLVEHEWSWCRSGWLVPFCLDHCRSGHPCELATDPTCHVGVERHPRLIHLHGQRQVAGGGDVLDRLGGEAVLPGRGSARRLPTIAAASHGVPSWKTTFGRIVTVHSE